MSLFSEWLASWRQSDRPQDARLYYDAPVTIRASHLDQIAEILRRTTSNPLTLYVNKRPVPVEQGYGYVPRIADLVQIERRYEEPESISMTNGIVTVYFARAASASSTSTLPQHMGSLWAVRRVLDGARWRAGTLLFRYWGALAALVGVFVVSVWSVSSPSPILMWIALACLALTLILALGIGVFRRVRLDVRTAEEKVRGRGIDTLLSGLIYPALLVILTAVATPLGDVILPTP